MLAASRPGSFGIARGLEFPTAEPISADAAGGVREAIGKTARRLPLIREVGRGGMGIVYLARQISDRRLRQRFRLRLTRSRSRGLRTRPGTQLHHPNIVLVFSVGCERASTTTPCNTWKVARPSAGPSAPTTRRCHHRRPPGMPPRPTTRRPGDAPERIQHQRSARPNRLKAASTIDHLPVASTPSAATCTIADRPPRRNRRTCCRSRRRVWVTDFGRFRPRRPPD